MILRETVVVIFGMDETEIDVAEIYFAVVCLELLQNFRRRSGSLKRDMNYNTPGESSCMPTQLKLYQALRRKDARSTSISKGNTPKCYSRKPSCLKSHCPNSDKDQELNDLVLSRPRQEFARGSV